MQEGGSTGEERKRSSAASLLLKTSIWLAASTRKSDKISSVIDERHMWLAKRIAQGFGIVDVSEVERIITSKSVLDKVNRFFGKNSPRTLYCYCFDRHVDNLRVNFEPEEIGQGKVMYFVRTVGTMEIVGHNISEELLVGECGASVIKSFSSTLHNVYVPMITADKIWGSGSDDDRAFFSQLSRFSMTLIDVVQTLDSRVQLRRVDSKLLDTMRRSVSFGDNDELQGSDRDVAALDTSTEPRSNNASDSKAGNLSRTMQGSEGPEGFKGGSNTAQHKEDHTHTLENIASEWKRAVDGFLDQEDPTLESLQDWGPDAPLVYWRERLAHLNALNEQFEASETKVVVGALTQVCMCV